VSAQLDVAALSIRPIGGDAEAETCARHMASSEPWITLGRDYEASLALFRDPGRERYVAHCDDRFAGFLVLVMQGAFTGYIQSIYVVPELRNQGVGAALIRFAENRIFRESPNVFMCVSSFNQRARNLYGRLGYELIGELRDYVVAGHAELLFRKSVAPMNVFRPSMDNK
jgi:ribosomal-protein-alanine N-acetyltransferase